MEAIIIAWPHQGSGSRCWTENVGGRIIVGISWGCEWGVDQAVERGINFLIMTRGIMIWSDQRNQLMMLFRQQWTSCSPWYHLKLREVQTVNVQRLLRKTVFDEIESGRWCLSFMNSGVEYGRPTNVPSWTLVQYLYIKNCASDQTDWTVRTA